MRTIQFENTILDIINNQSVTAETISVITGMPMNYILNKLNKLEKWGVIERVTTKQMIIWGLPRKNQKRGQSPSL